MEIGSREGQYMSTTAKVGREMVRRGYSDQEIERRTGVAISLIFELESEAGFRRREEAILRQ